MLRVLFAGLLLCWSSASFAGTHGASTSTPPAAGKTVVNFQYATSDLYNNIIKGVAFSLGTNSPTLFFSDGYPIGTLTADLVANPNPAANTGIGVDGYYGFYDFVGTGTSTPGWQFQFAGLIVYSGGAGVSGISPSASGTTTGGSAIFQTGANQPTNPNIKFKFGGLVTSVATSVGGDACGAGLVKFGFQTAALTGGTPATMQFNNGTNLPAGPNADASWSVTKLDNQTVCLTGSSALAGTITVTAAGGPGTQTEGIYIPGNGNIRILAGAQNLTSAILCLDGNLAAAQAGQIVTQSAINAFVDLKPGYFRYMDALGTQGTYANFSDGYTATRFNYSAGLAWFTGYWAGTSSNSGDDLTVSNPSSSGVGAYQDGETVQFNSNRTTTGMNARLQLGTRGFAQIISTDTQSSNYSPIIMKFATASTALANTSVVGNGTIATVTTTVAHGLTNGAVYGITLASTATPSFNATYFCTVTGASTFTCPSAIVGTAATPGTWRLITATNDIISITFTGSTVPSGSYTYQYYVNTTQTLFTGTLAAGTNILTAGAPTQGVITPGQILNGDQSTGRVILPYGTQGTTGVGGAGTYAVSQGRSSLLAVTSTQGWFGPESNLGTVNANILQALNVDNTIGIFGFGCGNTGNFTGMTCWYPLGNGAVTVTSSTSGTATEGLLPGTLNAGNIANASNYTLQYSGTMKAWLHGGAGGLFHGIPLDLIKEVSNRTGIGAFIPMPVEYTQASYQALGAYAAANMPGISIITEIGNEEWNSNSGVYGRGAGMGAAMGMGNPLAGLFRSGVDSFQSLRTAQNLPSFTTGYTGAGGSASLVHPTIQNWALAALTNPPDGNMVKSIWEGGSTTQAGTFTGTLGTTNGVNTVTVSGLVGNWRIYPAQALTGSCVSAGTHIVRNDGLASQFAGNGVYVIDVAQSGTCTVTATNPAYNLSSGPGGAAASTVYNTAPTRAIDLVDGVGYAVYYFGALIRQGAGQSFTAVAQSIYETPVNLFQASADYAQGVATSNSTLINNALNIVATDLVAGTKNGSPGTDIANKFIGSGAYSGAGNGVAPSFEALIAVYDGARPSGKANLSVYQYEGGEQQTLCSGNPCGSGTTVGDAGTVASQFTTNGWTTLDATYGYPGFGAGSTVTALNMVNMFLGFVRSTQFYHTQLCLMQQIGAVHAARPVFAPAQYGINGAGSLNSPGAALWGIYTGVGISTPKQGNYTALKDFSNGVTATCP